MAFSVSNAQTGVSAAGTPHTVNLPSNIVAGSLLVCIARVNNATAGFTFPAGWQQLKDQSHAGTSADRVAIYYKHVQTGDAEIGAATMSVTPPASSKGAYRVHRIDGHAAGVTPEISADATGTSTTPNPASLTPSWGALENLWLWMGSWEGEQTNPPATAPTNYSTDVTWNGATSGTAGNVDTNCRVATGGRILNAASEDPGSCTISVSDDWIAWVVAIKPAGVAASGSSSARGGGSVAGVASKGGLEASSARGGGTSAAAASKGGTVASEVRGGGAVASVGGAPTFDFSGTSSVRGGGSATSVVAKSASGSSTARGGGAASSFTRKEAAGPSSSSGGGTVGGAGQEGALRDGLVRGGGFVTSTAAKQATRSSSVRGGGSLAGTGTSAESHSGTSTVRGGGKATTSAAGRNASSSSSARGGGFVMSVGVKSPVTGTSTVRGGGTLILIGTSSRTAFSLARGGGFVNSTGVIIPPAQPPLGSPTTSSPASGRTKSSADSGRTLSGVASGRTRRG